MSVDERDGLLETVVAEPAPGLVFDDRYEIVDSLGEGGVGQVYAARRVKLGLPVAIKVLRHQSAADAEIRLRFEREARAMASLSHPNIVSVTDFGVWEKRPYLVMELLEGQTLRQRLRKGPMPIEHVMHVIRQFLQGLSYAHSMGLVHRDLKPENIFLQRLPDQLPHVKILDFGFAKLIDENMPAHVRDLTRSGVVFGTPAYMSPEQAMGDAMDLRTDVYAAGVILFEALSGKRPFEGDFAEVRRLKVSEKAPDPSELCPELRVESSLLTVLRKALATQKTDRYADASEMLEAIKVLPKRPAVRRAAQRSLGERVRLSLKRRWPLLFAAAIALAAGAAYLLSLDADAGTATAAEASAAASVAASGESPPSAAPEEGQGEPPPSPGREPDAREAESGEMVITTEEVEAEGVQAADEQSDRPAAGNPWKRGRLPGRVGQIRRRALKGRELSESAIKPVIEFARSNRDDPRGSLILAYAFVNRNWLSDAIERYRMAYHIDASARGDDRMRRDLVRLVTVPKVRSVATSAVLEIYGQEALGEIDRSLRKDRLTEAERATLQALRSRLQGG